MRITTGAESLAPLSRRQATRWLEAGKETPPRAGFLFVRCRVHLDVIGRAQDQALRRSDFSREPLILLVLPWHLLVLPPWLS